MSHDTIVNIGLVGAVIATLVVSGIWVMVMRWYRKKIIAKTRKEFETRLPYTIEEIEAERELSKAKHIHELRVMELRISELEMREAESNLKTRTALGRVSKLNDRVERLRLELAAERQRKKIATQEEI
jgi:hypothetical protein